jgi:hypothetical protein
MSPHRQGDAVRRATKELLSTTGPGVTSGLVGATQTHLESKQPDSPMTPHNQLGQPSPSLLAAARWVVRDIFERPVR